MAKINKAAKPVATDNVELLEHESSGLSTAIRWLFYSILLIVPLYFNINDVEAFEVPKGFVFYMLGFAILALWGYKIFGQKQFIYRKTILDIPVLIFFAGQLIATIFSVAPNASFWGREDSHVGGLLFTFMLTALYFAFTHHFYDLKKIMAALQVLVFSGIAIMIYAIFQHFGYDRIDWATNSGAKVIRVHGTLGQANWMGAYFVMLGFFALALEFYRNFKDGKYNFSNYSIFTYTYIFFCYLDLTFTVSRSGIIGFWIGSGFAAVALVALGIRFKAWNLIIATALIAVLAGAGTLFGVLENKFAVQQFSSAGLAAGENVRGFTWKAAIDTWKQNPKNIIIGTGPETFDYDYNLIRPAEHNKYHILNFTKVHNEVLHFLATSGLLGLAGYIITLAVLAFIVIRSFIATIKSTLNVEMLIQLAMGASVVAFFTSNFFGFSATATAIGNNVIMALMAVAFGVSTKIYAINLGDGLRTGLKWASIAVFSICSFLAMQLHIADVSFISAQRDLNEKKDIKYIKAMQEARDMGSFGPFGHIYKRDISHIYAIAALSYARAGRMQEANDYINKAIKEIQEVTKDNPRNQNVYRVAAATYFELGQLDPRYTQAGIAMMEKAEALGPTFPDMPMSIASVYISIGDRDNALKYINRVLELQDNYPNALITKIGLLYDMNKSTEANKILTDFIAANKQFNPQDNIEGLKQVLIKAKQTDMLNKLNAYLTKQASAGAAAK